MEEEINVKIASKDRAFWLNLKEKLETDVKNAKNEILINESLLSGLVSQKLEEFKD